MIEVKIGVIHESNLPTPSSRLLIEAIRKLGHESYYMPFSYISVRIDKRHLVLKIGSKPFDIDAGLLRSIGFAPSFEQFMGRLALFMGIEEEGIYLMNSIRGLLNARNKFMTLLKLFKAGIPVPKALLTENLVEAYRLTKQWDRVVVKPLIGSRGYGQVLVDNADLGYRIFRTCLQFKQFIFLEEYLNKPSRDIRLFVIGERVSAAMYRYAPPDAWKTNIAQGGKAEPMKPSPELEELAVKTAEILELDYAGVDVLEGSDGYYVLEANGSPGFEGLMRVTGINIPCEIVSYLVEKAKR